MKHFLLLTATLACVVLSSCAIMVNNNDSVQNEVSKSDTVGIIIIHSGLQSNNVMEK